MAEQALRGTISDRAIREIWRLVLGESDDVFRHDLVEVVLTNGEGHAAAPLKAGFPTVVRTREVVFQAVVGANIARFEAQRLQVRHARSKVILHKATGDLGAMARTSTSARRRRSATREEASPTALRAVLNA